MKAREPRDDRWSGSRPESRWTGALSKCFCGGVVTDMHGPVEEEDDEQEHEHMPNAPPAPAGRRARAARRAARSRAGAGAGGRLAATRRVGRPLALQRD